jgi:hypothetical protein
MIKLSLTKMVKKIPLILITFFSIALVSKVVLALPAFLDRRPEEKQKQTILVRSSEILAKLYQAQPEAKTAVESAYGYATFSNFGTKIIFVGGGTGRGLAVNNKTKEKTFMNMAELQAGLGLGIKNLRWSGFLKQKADLINSSIQAGKSAVKLPRLQNSAIPADLYRGPSKLPQAFGSTS